MKTFVTIRKILPSIMLMVSIFGWGQKANDSTPTKNRERKSETATIFISKGTYVDGKEIIYNAKFSVIKKKSIKSNSNFLVHKKTTPAKVEQKIQIKKINYYENIISNGDSDKKLQAIFPQKGQFITLLEQYASDLTIPYKTAKRLYFLKKLLPSNYNHPPIEEGKNMSLSIRPPPKKTFSRDSKKTRETRKAFLH